MAEEQRLSNLGWLAGSAVQPRKRKEIEGACLSLLTACIPGAQALPQASRAS